MTFREWVSGYIVPFIDLGLVPLLYAIAFLWFMYGMARFFFSDNEEKRKSGRQFAIWGIIAFVVLFSLWGIIRLLLTVLPPEGSSSEAGSNPLGAPLLDNEEIEVIRGPAGECDPTTCIGQCEPDGSCNPLY